jgi:hypothetical protein
MTPREKVLEMKNVIKLAAIGIVALGMGAASTSAFAAGCLTNQNQMVTPSLTDNLMAESGSTATALPAPFDVAQYRALLAKGNTCPTTQQSLPLDQQQSYHGSAFAR